MRTRSAIHVVVVLGALPGAALAQNVLDRNLEVGSQGVNRPMETNRFSDRNFIITNNVVGGRGFRGSVGYGPPDGFRAETGSDALYDFRADSAISDVSFIGQSFTYEQLRFGQVLNLVEFRRESQGATEQAQAEGFFRPNEFTLARLKLDQFSFSSSSANQTDFRSEPRILGAFTSTDDGSTQVLQASNFSGISVLPLAGALQVIGLTSYDHARISDDIMHGRNIDEKQVGVNFENRYEDLLVAAQRAEDTRIDSRAPGTEPEPEPDDEAVAAAAPAVESGLTYADIQERVARRFAETDDPDIDETEPLPAETVKTLQERLEALREELSEMGRRPEPVEDGEAPRGNRRLGSPSAPPIIDETELLQVPENPTRAEDFGLILRHGQRIDHLAVKDGTRFSELVSSAERALADGDYFWAERRFNRALRFTPGHPLATAGLAHAQIGAGLYVSAAVTLRSLFAFQPEMIDVRFDDALIPNRPRLQRAVISLQEQIEKLSDREERGMLLAYVGRLLDDEKIIREGFAVYREAAPDAPLLPLLESIWLAPYDSGTNDDGTDDR